MIAVAVQGYGLVIWNEPRTWQVYATSTRRGSSLSARVDDALRDTEEDGADAVRRALLSITGAMLLADSAFPECDGDCGGECDEADFRRN